MLRKFYLPLFIFVVAVFIDQYIKTIFVNGYERQGECISLVLAYNKGVAFSMFSFLEGNLKYLQIVLLFLGAIYLYIKKEVFYNHCIAIALLYAGAISNIYDRFVHIGVVDYVYWHCGFDFAIFNLADVLIDIAVVLILFKSYKEEREIKKNNNS
jgi:signal peptidase II